MGADPRSPRVAKGSTYLRKRPRQARAEATFDAIVEAAARILTDEGAGRLTTNRIATRAGVSVGSLYQYFPDKRSIVRALLERELARAEALRPAVLDDAARDAAERVRAGVDWHLDVHARHPELARVLAALLDEVLPEDVRRRARARRRARVRATLGSGVGAPSGEALAHAAFLVDVCLDAVADAAAHEHPGWLASERFRARLAAVLEAALAPLPPAAPRRRPAPG